MFIGRLICVLSCKYYLFVIFSLLKSIAGKFYSDLFPNDEFIFHKHSHATEEEHSKFGLYGF